MYPCSKRIEGEIKDAEEKGEKRRTEVRSRADAILTQNLIVHII